MADLTIDVRLFPTFFVTGDAAVANQNLIAIPPGIEGLSASSGTEHQASRRLGGDLTP